MKEILPKNKGDKLFFDDLTAKVEEFNEHFANIGKTTFEKTQILNQGADWAVDHGSDEHTNRNDYFRPQPVDVNTVILAVKQ